MMGAIGLLTSPVKGNRRIAAEGASAPESSLGEYLGATAEESIERQSASVLRWLTRQHPLDERQRRSLEALGDRVPEIAAPITAEEATESYGIEGHLEFENEILADTARELHDLKRDELKRRDVMARGPGGFFPTALGFAVGLGTSVLDPLNLASAFVPAVGPARYALWLNRAAGASGRAGVRAGVGAAEGAVGAALVEPVFWGAAVAEQADYGAVDALLNLAFGTILGGGLHTGVGAIADRVTRSSPAQREAAFRAAVAELADEGQVTRAADAFPEEATPAEVADLTARLAELQRRFDAGEPMVQDGDPVPPLDNEAAAARGAEVLRRMTDAGLDGLSPQVAAIMAEHPLVYAGGVGTRGVREVLRRIAAGRRLLRDRTPIREGVARDNESFQGASDLIKTMAQHDYTLAKSISSGLSEARYLTFHGPQYRMSKKGRAEFFREFKTANAPFSGEIDIRVAGHSGSGRPFGGAPHFQWSIDAPSSENATRISDMMMRLSDLSAQHPFGGGGLHTGVGAIADRVTRSSPAQREAAFRAAVAELADEGQVTRAADAFPEEATPAEVADLTARLAELQRRFDAGEPMVQDGDPVPPLDNEAAAARGAEVLRRMTDAGLDGLSPEDATAALTVDYPRPAHIPQEIPASEIPPPGGDLEDHGLRLLRPDQIDVDAVLFQFKSGGDEFGVTEALRGITVWDPVKADQLVVYEFADGRVFIADGHQRLALAKRITALDPSQKIVLVTRVLKETDGISPAMARGIAAARNIAHGTGTAADAAKILRDAPELDIGLPPNSRLVRQARALVNLSDEAFGLVVNGIIPARYASIVGDLLPGNPDLQLAVLRVLAKTEPANTTQAESIVRQAIDAGAERTTTASLFGEEEILESLYLERAKVLDRAMRQLRRDKATFANLTKNRGRIEAAGNVLDAEGNIKKAESDAIALHLIQVLAARRGGLSDALNAAAARAKAEGRFDGATADFVDAVRRGVEEGDFDRVEVGGSGRAGDVEAQGEGGAGADAAPGPREAQQPDLDLRQDLGRLVDAGATVEEIEAHPAIVQALEAADAIPETHLAEGYGSDEWIAERRFIFGDEEIVGYKAGAERLYEDAQRLAWVDDGLDPPAEGIAFDRHVVIVLGPPASGKSTIANILARRGRAAIIDVDEAKKVLPEYADGVGSNATHVESTALGGLMEARARADGANVVLPMTGRDKTRVTEMIARFKADGYEVDIVDVMVAPEEAYRRMLSRFVKTGRLINPEYARSIGDAPMRSYDAIKKEGGADGFTRIDNNGAFGEPKRIVEDQRDLTQKGELFRPGRGGEGGGQADGDAADAAAGRGVQERGQGAEGGEGAEFQLEAERQAPAPEPEEILPPGVERTEAGEQHVLEGAERISDRELAERRMADHGPVREVEQEAPGGLFAGRLAPEEATLLDAPGDEATADAASATHDAAPGAPAARLDEAAEEVDLALEEMRAAGLDPDADPEIRAAKDLAAEAEAAANAYRAGAECILRSAA